LHLEEHVAAGSHWWVKSAALLQVGFKERVNTFGKEFTVEERNLLSFANKNTTFFYMKIEVKLAHTCGILICSIATTTVSNLWMKCGRSHGDELMIDKLSLLVLF
jgi:hypothetical protein